VLTIGTKHPWVAINKPATPNVINGNPSWMAAREMKKLGRFVDAVTATAYGH